MAKKNTFLKNAKKKLVTKLSPKSPVTEQYRTIRTNIQFASVDKSIRSLIVTSTGPMEGKSTTAANLAIVFAQQGTRVLFIDADLRRPTMHYTFNKTNTVGLTTVLTQQTSLTEAVQGTEIGNLSILTSGPIPPNPAELLGSRAMEQLLETTKEHFDLIIIDSPPLLAVTDSSVLANYCDGAVMVVSSGVTNKDAAKKAKEQLLQTKAKLLGVVLNNKKTQKNDFYYYYGK